MNVEFFTDEEYDKAFVEFGGIRGQIAERIHQMSFSNPEVILDFLSGHGFLSVEMRIRFSEARIIGTGLINDVVSYQQVRKSKSFSQSLWNNFEFIECDVLSVPLKSESCDIVTNFLGLEDLNMTRGRRGVEQAFDEIERVTRSGALIQISYVDYGDAPEEKLAQEIWETIGLNAIFYNRDDYLALLESHHMIPIDEFECKMEKKMTARQAREELLFACQEAPKIFTNFEVKSLDFPILWNKFSKRLETHGMAFWSPIHVIISLKQ